MSELILRPNSDSACSWWRSTGTVNYVLVNEDPVDDGTDVRTTSSGWTDDIYGLTDPSTKVGRITNVRVSLRCKNSSGSASNAKALVKVDGTVYYGSGLPITASWGWKHTDWATNPKTGAAWTWSEIDALLAGPSGCRPQLYGTLYCSNVYVTVTYVVEGGAVFFGTNF